MSELPRVAYYCALRPANPPEGAGFGACSICSREVMFNPATLALVRKFEGSGVPLICNECAERELGHVLNSGVSVH